MMDPETLKFSKVIKQAALCEKQAPLAAILEYRDACKCGRSDCPGTGYEKRLEEALNRFE